MKNSIITAAAACLAALIVAMPVAGLANMVDIDCSSSSFALSDDGYHVDCPRSDGEVRAETAKGASQVDVINITGDDPRVFITVIGVRVTATRIYLERRSLRENFGDVFGNIDEEDWKEIEKDGYERAEFNAEISGLPSSCVAIQRYTNPAWIGFKRRIIGMGCSPVDREIVYAALTKLRAPGD